VIHHHGTVLVDAADPGDLTLYSVTSIINAVNAGGDGLTWWARYGVARLAVEGVAQWQNLPPDRAVKDLAYAHQHEQDIDRDTGNVVHAALEVWALSGERPSLDVVRGSDNLDRVAAEAMLDRFGEWTARARPVYEAAELVVYNPARGYAGTADAFMTVGGVRFISDYKTSRRSWDSDGKPRKPYVEQVALQLEAYRRATLAALFRARRIEPKFSPRYYALSEAEQAHSVAVPDVDAGLCIYITPEHCHAYPIVLDDRAWRGFLHAIDVYRWCKHDAKGLMGPPLDLGAVAEVA